MRLRIVLGLVVLLFHTSEQQHVFDNICSYTYSNENKTETLAFASQLYFITSKSYDVYINFCSMLGKVDPACNVASHVCAVRKRKPRRNILNKAVTGFQTGIEFNNNTKKDDYSMTAETQTICEDQPYEFKVLIDRTVATYQISSADICSLEIRIPHPSVLQRPCGFSYKGLIIDMKPLAELPEQYVFVNSTKVALAVCHSAASCSSGSNICEIDSKGRQFDVAEEQRINYDDRDNVIVVRGKKHKDKRIKSEIIINCNWTANFDKPTKLAAKYKYSIDSKYGCVKVPLNCEIADIQNYIYNLTALNRPTGWEVDNITIGSISTNVCGDLQHQTKTNCSDTFSQVCYRSGNKYLSYGALQSGLKFDGKDIILTYTHGSQCPMKPNEYLNTRITFICSSDGQGPVLSSIINCTMHITWKTQYACPYGLSHASHFGLKNLQKQLKETDDIDCNVLYKGQLFRFGSLKSKDSYQFDSKLINGVKYYINICRPISLTEDNYYCKITGACIEDSNTVDIRAKFIWIGSINPPRFENNEFVIRYDGGHCSNSSIGSVREVIIHFNCSSTQQPLKLQSETLCRVDFLWNTPLACKQRIQRSVNCKLKLRSGDIIDLTDLHNRHLHVINNNNTYAIDICSDAIILYTNATTITNEADSINASRQFFETDCNYWLNYTLANSTGCDAQDSLKSLKVNLLCNDISNNPDHIGNYSLNGCDATISMKSSLMCSYMQKCNSYLQVQEIKLSTDKIYQRVQPKPADCQITQNNFNVLINDIRGINTIVAGNNYSINEHKCSGFVCRNNRTLATLEQCPNIVIENDEKVVKVNLLGPICQNAFFIVKLNLKCEKDKDRTLTLLAHDIKSCSIVLTLIGNDTCALFKEQLQYESQSNNTTGLIIGIVLCIIIILGICVTLWMRKSKVGCFKNSCIDSSVRSRLLYFKNASE